MEFACHPVFGKNTEFLKINTFPSPHEEVCKHLLSWFRRKNSSRGCLVLVSYYRDKFFLIDPIQ